MRTEKILIGEIAMNDDRAEGGKGDIDSLARNMAKYGQINAVTVVEKISNSHRYRIIAGRRRIAAAESLGWNEIRADVYDAGEIGEDSEEMIALSENAAREEMNAIDEGILYANELKRGTPVDELAALFCRSKSAVYQRARLASLIPEMRELYKRGGMSLYIAAMAADLPEDAQKKIADEYSENGGGVVNEWNVKLAIEAVSEDYLDRIGNCADCVLCNKRTRYSDKTLFPELAERRDRCLDHKCYCKRLSARLENAFNEFSGCLKDSPEFAGWDGRRIVSSVALPDGLKVRGVPFIESDRNEVDITNENGGQFAENKAKLEESGKVEYVPCWNGKEFSLLELCKQSDIDSLSDRKNENQPSEWELQQRDAMSDIFRSLPEDRLSELLSHDDDWYVLKNRATEIFNEKMRSAVFEESEDKILVTEQIALVVLLYCHPDEIRKNLPEAGFSEDEELYSLSAYEKLLGVRRGAMLRLLLKSLLSGYRTKPGIQGLDGSNWQKIFEHLEIDLCALRDEAAKEAVSGNEDKTDETDSDDFSDDDDEEWSDEGIIYEGGGE